MFRGMNQIRGFLRVVTVMAVVALLSGCLTSRVVTSYGVTYTVGVFGGAQVSRIEYKDGKGDTVKVVPDSLPWSTTLSINSGNDATLRVVGTNTNAYDAITFSVKGVGKDTFFTTNTIGGLTAKRVDQTISEIVPYAN